jgi:hypothetical protein
MKKDRIVLNKGTYSVYLDKVPCKNCGDDIYASKQTLHKHGHAFCSVECKCIHTQKRKDPKGANILDNVKDADFYYLLGLLASDGTIIYPQSDNKYVAYACRLHLSKKDEMLLNDIHDKFGGTITSDRSKYIIWQLTHKKFLLFLKDIGITTKKTNFLDITLWFNTLDDKFKWSFFRGYFDGDGTIYRYTPKNAGYCIHNASIVFKSETVFNMFKQFFKTYHFREYTEMNKMGNTMYRLSFHGSYAIPVLRAMYDISGIKLKRKYNKYLNLKEYYERNNI